jgi:hypothetical protein
VPPQEGAPRDARGVGHWSAAQQPQAHVAQGGAKHGAGRLHVGAPPPVHLHSGNGTSVAVRFLQRPLEAAAAATPPHRTCWWLRK